MQSNDSRNPTTKTDIFFRRAYRGSHIDSRIQSAIDSVLGNIGAPLRVGGELENDEEDDKLQALNGEREYSPEGGADPLNLERTWSQSEREAINEGEISEFQV